MYKARIRVNLLNDVKKPKNAFKKHEIKEERKPFLTKLRNSTFAYLFYGISAFGLYTGGITAYSLVNPKSKVVSVAYGYTITPASKKIISKKLDEALPDVDTIYKDIKKIRENIIEYIKQRADGANISEENLKRLIKEEAKRRFELIFHPGGELAKLNAQFLDNVISQEGYFSKAIPLLVKAAYYVPLMFDSEDELNEMLSKVQARANAIDREIDDLMYKIKNYECEDRDACIRDAEALTRQQFLTDLEITALKAGDKIKGLYEHMEKAEEHKRRAQEYEEQEKKWEELEKGFEENEKYIKKGEEIDEKINRMTTEDLKKLGW